MDQTLSYNFFNTSMLAWNAMYEAIFSARQSIYWEIYGLADDAAGARFVKLLCERAKQGLDVKLILDGIGSMELASQTEKEMRLAGIKIVWHNKVNFNFPKIFFKKLLVRNHRKILIIDEKIIFIGGVNILVQASEWYDLHLKVERAAAAGELSRGFARSYINCGGRKEDVKDMLRHGKRLATDAAIRFIMHSPARNWRHPFYLRRFFWRALRQARQTFKLVTPYYAPDARFLQLLTKAVKRGVKADIFLPWCPDHRFMQWVAHAFYDFTSKTGASIHFLKKMNHAKAFSVDDCLGAVGSINLTPRSFFTNYEVAAYFSNQTMVGDLNNIFDSWESEAFSLSEVGWEKRGWHRRFREWWAEKIKNFV